MKRLFWSWGWVCKGCAVPILGLGPVSLIGYPTATVSAAGGTIVKWPANFAHASVLVAFYEPMRRQ